MSYALSRSQKLAWITLSFILVLTELLIRTSWSIVVQEISDEATAEERELFLFINIPLDSLRQKPYNIDMEERFNIAKFWGTQAPLVLEGTERGSNLPFAARDYLCGLKAYSVDFSVNPNAELTSILVRLGAKFGVDPLAMLEYAGKVYETQKIEEAKIGVLKNKLVKAAEMCVTKILDNPDKLNTMEAGELGGLVRQLMSGFKCLSGDADDTSSKTSWDKITQKAEELFQERIKSLGPEVTPAPQEGALGPRVDSPSPEDIARKVWGED